MHVLLSIYIPILINVHYYIFFINENNHINIFLNELHAQR